jgi:hypothetical protein
MTENFYASPWYFQVVTGKYESHLLVFLSAHESENL